MRKRFIFAFMLTVFAAAQLLVAVHSAEFGSAMHEHDGHVCGIWLFADQGHSTALPEPVAIINAPLQIESFAASTDEISSNIIVAELPPARAPPARG